MTEQTQATADMAPVSWRAFRRVLGQRNYYRRSAVMGWSAFIGSWGGYAAGMLAIQWGWVTIS